jgi:phosphoglycolate phosphatase-like HAD superfamily hydrolase
MVTPNDGQFQSTNAVDPKTVDPKTKEGHRLTFGHRTPLDEFSSEHLGAAVQKRDQSCIDIRFIPQGRTVIIDCAIAVTDNDDTLLLHTGEHIHDGHRARFALALSDLLVAHHYSTGGSFLTSDHLEAYQQTGSIFDAEGWDHYRQKTGKSEDTVLEGILQLALQRFDLTHHPEHMTTDHYRDAVSKVLEVNFDSFMKRVETDEGLKSLFEEMQRQGVPVGVCSASSDKFVRAALQLAGVDHLVNHYVCSAVKKKSCGEYLGDDLKKTCEALGGKPREAVMFGDTMNDIGAAVLAGVPVIIIRVPGGVTGGDGSNASLVGQVHQQILNQVNTFGTQQHYQTQVLSHGYDSRPTVLLVHDFSQVIFGSRLREGMARFCES